MTRKTMPKKSKVLNLITGLQRRYKVLYVFEYPVFVDGGGVDDILSKDCFPYAQFDCT